jgi:hypothetical protein
MTGNTIAQGDSRSTICENQTVSATLEQADLTTHTQTKPYHFSGKAFTATDLCNGCVLTF